MLGFIPSLFNTLIGFGVVVGLVVVKPTLFTASGMWLVLGSLVVVAGAILGIVGLKGLIMSLKALGGKK